jgi:hypothetical protein
VFYIIAICVVAFVLALGTTLYFKLKGHRSERDRRAKAMSRFLAREAATGGSGSGETGSGDLGGDGGGDD